MPINPVNVKPQAINNYSFPRRFIRGMGTGAMLPLIALECFVTGGRTIQAYQRGGFDEARERFTEEAIGAAFWFAGVKCFNKMNDWIGKKALNLVDANFDVGRDRIRNPLANYLRDKGKGLSEKTIGKFKLAKVGASIILANILVGLVVPKINQKITVKLHEKREGNNAAKQSPQTKPLNENNTQDYFQFSMNKFAGDNDKKKKELNFGMSAQGILSLANHFENDNIYQLLSTDAGIAGGRAVSSRNKHERTEVLFRDLSSIYFYMFSIPNIHSWLNWLDSGKKTRLDPVASKQVTDQLKLAYGNNKNGLSPEEFKKLAFGDDTNCGWINREMDSKFDQHGIIKLEDLLEQIKKHSQIDANQVDAITERVKAMATLQPKVEGVSILTKAQVEDAFRGGALNMPEFLNNLYGLASNNEMFGNSTKYKHQDPYRFVSHEELKSLKDDMHTYIEQIIKKAERTGKKITIKTIEKADRINLAKNAFNRGVGFAVSALFLSTLIPKMQYWITAQLTGKNSFPGMTDYSDEKKTKTEK